MEGQRCRRVKLHNLNFRVASLATREVALVGRERSVRITLERELDDLQRGREGRCDNNHREGGGNSRGCV